MRKTLLFLILAIISLNTLKAQVPASERNALIALYNATNGTSWTNSTNWNTAQPVNTWFGITVQNIGGQEHVTNIVIPNNNLQGTLPTDIGSFPELKQLWLYSNPGVSGGIPTEIGDLTNLTDLAFAWNQGMTGTIPASIGNLSNLASMYLNSNRFTGSLPSSLGNLTNLQILRLDENLFSESIPDLTNLPLSTLKIEKNLFQFGDFENEFTSYLTISSFSYSPQWEPFNTSNIEAVNGDNVSMTSTVSGVNNTYQWYKVISTTAMSYDPADATLLTGETNATLSLTNLQNTDFGYYYCMVSNTVVTGLEIKQESFKLIHDVPQIEKDALIAFYNATDGPNWTNNTNWSSSEPIETWQGVYTENGHVFALSLYNNNLTGTLPTALQDLAFIKTLYLRKNHLSGIVPDLTGISTLNRLSISDNDFHFGDFENEFTTYNNYSSTGGYFQYFPMNKLETEISEDIVIGNNYTFTMPNVSGTNVTYQWFKNDVALLGGTGLTYTITNAQATDAGNYYCTASSTIIPDLKIQRNTIHLYSTILAADRNALVMLYYATTGANWVNNTNWNTSAPVYEWYGVEMEGNRVKSINLATNNLVGTLPNQIGDLDYIQTLDLSYNTISGSLPTEIGNLTNLLTWKMIYNQISGAIPTSIGNLTALEYLDFWHNQLSGSIPTEIGNCTSLKKLSFWQNQLTGAIPTSMGNLVNLETLSLEDNQLTGNIPLSFSNLTAMGSFWINGNQLSGIIPNIFSNWTALYFFSIGNGNGTAGAHNDFTGDLDLSNNSSLKLCFIDNTQLSSVNVQNGNNTNFSSGSWFYAINCPNLSCVFVDDTAYSLANWTSIDASATYVDSVASCDALVPLSEKKALIALYDATTGVNWVNQTNWKTPTPVSTWYGITVENVAGQNHVTKIEFPYFNGDNNLNGVLPPEIGNFPELTVLDISHNVLLTSSIPTEIGNLTKLTTLSFWDDDFTGVIPDSIGNCTQIGTLSLEDNRLTGNIPSSFSNLTAMGSFWINGNQLSGVLPNIFSNWATLYHFSIGNGNHTAGAHNDFTGDLDLSTNTNLQLCWVDNTLISSLDVRNGINNIISNGNFNATNCPNLTCIFVDDAPTSVTNWTNVDATATFVETQTACDALYVSENTFDEAITIYPNPSSSILNIDYNGNSPISKINIVNTLGQKVKVSYFNNNIDITALKQGVYILKLENESGKIASFRFVKK